MVQVTPKELPRCAEHRLRRWGQLRRPNFLFDRGLPAPGRAIRRSPARSLRLLSMKCGSVVIELYPVKNHRLSCVRLGIVAEVADRGAVTQLLVDPDGNRIEITGMSASVQQNETEDHLAAADQ